MHTQKNAKYLSNGSPAQDECGIYIILGIAAEKPPPRDYEEVERFKLHLFWAFFIFLNVNSMKREHNNKNIERIIQVIYVIIFEVSEYTVCYL